jgi:hypothetical protein
MAVLHTFFNFEGRQTVITICRGISRQSSVQKIVKNSHYFLQRAVKAVDGQHCLLRTYHGVFFKGGEIL